MKHNKSILCLILMIFLINIVFALSNESIQANKLINQAEKDITEMQLRNIPINRVNESYQDAVQLYAAQTALERTSKKADFDLVIRYATNVNDVKKIAFKADDELKIFLENYNSISEEVNLSEMDEDYNAIINSFNSERFEDTLELIDVGYERLSEVQSSQTTIKLFYSATSRSVKVFLKDNWLWLVTSFIATLLFLLIFKTALSKLHTQRKMKHLDLQKNTINYLIKNLQKSYFKTKKTSELEYRIKLKKFNEMILDINRQIPLLKEEMIKLTKKKFKKSISKKIKKVRV